MAKVLYAGDGAFGGASNYLYAVLSKAGFEVTYLGSEQVLTPAILKRGFDLVILSDYPKRNCSLEAEAAIWTSVKKGAGLLMVGGWASFSGPSGGWHGSLIEDILPVVCKKWDDRTNFPSGAAVVFNEAHPALSPDIFRQPPVLCGLNHFKIKKNGKLLLSARPLKLTRNAKKLTAAFEEEDFPLLAVDGNAKKKVAAFAADLAPHWCGGLVDWGAKSVRLPVKGGIFVEVGESYIRFISELARWLSHK